MGARVGPGDCACASRHGPPIIRPNMPEFRRPGRPLKSSSASKSDANPASLKLLRLKTAKRLSLRSRMGLLRHKAVDEELDDVERKLLEHELAIAGELQANLLPKKIPPLPGFELTAYYKPSREVGGDYYDFLELDADHVGILVADVSGKGIPASIVMTETRALIKSEAVRTLSPSEAVVRVNRVLHQDIKRGMFVTMYYMILSIPKRTLTVTSCGHNPMVIWRNGTNTCHLVNPGGLALGIDPGPFFEKTVKEQRIQLFEGDRFLIYTDGVVECMNSAGEILGPNRLYTRVKQIASKNSSEFLSLLVAEMEAHQGSAPQHDDITIVTGRLLPPDPGETAVEGA